MKDRDKSVGQGVFTGWHFLSRFEGNPFLKKGPLIRLCIVFLIGVALGSLLKYLLHRHKQVKGKKQKQVERKRKLEDEQKKIQQMKKREKDKWLRESCKLAEQEKKVKEELEEIKRQILMEQDESQTGYDDAGINILMSIVREIEKLIRPSQVMTSKSAEAKKDAELEANHLCEKAKLVIRNVCNGIHMTEGSVLPVAVALGKCLAIDDLKHKAPLLLSLIRALRLFLQLSWYQRWSREKEDLTEWLIRVDVLDEFSRIVEKWQNCISKLPTGYVVDCIAFELQCAEQTVKCMAKIKVTVTPRLFQSKVHLGIVEAWKVVKIGQYQFHSSVAPWYEDIFALQWLAACITGEGNFDHYITSATMDAIRKSGDQNYTLCLAIILMETIETSSSFALQMCALEGNEHQKGLVHLLDLRAARWALSDSFLGIRRVVIQYLWQSVTRTEEKHEALRAKCLEWLESHHQSMQGKLSDGDYKNIGKALKSLKESPNAKIPQELEAQRNLAR